MWKQLQNVRFLDDIGKLLGWDIQDSARVAKPLFDLLKDGNENGKKIRSSPRSKPKGQLSSKTPFIWSKQHQQALEHQITCLILSPILACPDYNQPSIFHTDPSADGLDDKKVSSVIGYGSRALTSAEKGYHLPAGKLEFLAMCKHFRDYLFYSLGFTVYTDNTLLTYILTSARLNATGHH